MKKEDLIKKNIKAIKASVMAEEAFDENFEKDNERLLKLAQSYIEQQDSHMLYAAKGKPVGYNGSASGIAVSEEGDRAIIIKCHAYIDKEIDKKGQIEICGIPVTKKPDGTETRSPLDSLEEKLKGPIRALPVFRDFNLHKRYINIDIGESHFTETWSLSLAVVMSILNAIYEREEDPFTVYSANVISNGTLEPVERIVRKLTAAKEQGIKQFVLSAKNRPNVPKEFLNTPGFKVLFCENLDQVMEFMHISKPENNSPATKCFITAKKKLVTKQKVKSPKRDDSNGEFAMYKPKPIDTDHIKIPKYLEKLIELLSENSHDIWARQRMEEGWTFGPERNDPKKKHPDLIPYEELLPSEQEYDRLTVMGVLKAIIALGYRIEKK